MFIFYFRCSILILCYFAICFSFCIFLFSSLCCSWRSLLSLCQRVQFFRYFFFKPKRDIFLIYVHLHIVLHCAHTTVDTWCFCVVVYIVNILWMKTSGIKQQLKQPCVTQHMHPYKFSHLCHTSFSCFHWSSEKKNTQHKTVEKEEELAA